MAVIRVHHHDGTAGTTPNATVGEGYTQSGGTVTGATYVTGGAPGNAIEMPSAVTGYYQDGSTGSPITNAGYWGFKFWLPTLPASGCSLGTLVGSNGTTHIAAVTVTSAGKLQLWNAINTLVDTSTLTLSATTWYRLGWHPSGATQEMRVWAPENASNYTEVLTGSANTGTLGIYRVGHSWGGNNVGVVRYDEVVLADSWADMGPTGTTYSDNLTATVVIDLAAAGARTVSDDLAATFDLSTGQLTQRIATDVLAGGVQIDAELTGAREAGDDLSTAIAVDAAVAGTFEAGDDATSGVQAGATAAGTVTADVDLEAGVSTGVDVTGSVSTGVSLLGSIAVGVDITSAQTTGDVLTVGVAAGSALSDSFSHAYVDDVNAAAAFAAAVTDDITTVVSDDLTAGISVGSAMTGSRTVSDALVAGSVVSAVASASRRIGDDLSVTMAVGAHAVVRARPSNASGGLDDESWSAFPDPEPWRGRPEWE